MTGVEILSSKIIYNTFIPEWWEIIALLVFLVSGFVGAWLCTVSERPKIGVICMVLGTCLFIGLASCASTENKNDINHIEYKVTIDDSVSMNEFLDKYEILDQEGKIYTVKERE